MLAGSNEAAVAERRSPDTERVLLLNSRSTPELDYYLYVPDEYAAKKRILVSVHGVSRNAWEHVAFFRQYAHRHGVILVAPFFKRKIFRDYQRLGRKGVGPRADLALIRLLNEISRQTDSDTSKIDLFGFSGGAQFAHRFAFAYPQRVRRLALGAAGWYTMPDKSTPYPYGIANTEGLDAVCFKAAAIARISALVVVGEYDNKDDDEALNQSEIIRKAQGGNRLARARAWTERMNRLAAQQGSSACVELAVLPGISHSFRQAILRGGLAERLFDYFYQPRVPAAPSLSDFNSTEKTGWKVQDSKHGS